MSTDASRGWPVASRGPEASADPPASAGTAGVLPRVRTLLLIAATLFGVALAFAISANRAFQVDEVETIHAAYNLASGKLIYRDFWQGHHPLLYWLLSGTIPTADPSLAFLASRLLCFAMFLATIVLSAVVTARLGGLGWLTAALLVLETTFVERGLEVRPDSLMTLFVVLALWVGTLRDRGALLRSCLQGALLGLAFVTTQKAAIASLAFGCVWLATAFGRRDWKRVVLPCLVWALPFAIMLAVLGALDALDSYVLYNLSHPGESIRGQAGASAARFSALGPLIVEGSRNIAFVVAAIGSLGTALWLVLRRERPELATVTALATIWIAGLFVMPFPYPYSQAGGLPALAIAIGVIVPAWVDRAPLDEATRPRVLAGLACLLVIMQMVSSLPRLLREPSRSNDYQLHLLERVAELTDEGDRVFDLAGLYFRDDAYPVYLMTGAHYVRYEQGDYPPIAPWLREHGLSLFLVNYRTRWLSGQDREFLQTHFVRVEPNLFMSGSALDAMAPGAAKGFEVTRTDRYRFDGEGELLVDGRRFSEGVLERGLHELSTSTGVAHGRIVLSKAPPYDGSPGRDRPIFYAFD